MDGREYDRSRGDEVISRLENPDVSGLTDVFGICRVEHDFLFSDWGQSGAQYWPGARVLDASSAIFWYPGNGRDDQTRVWIDEQEGDDLDIGWRAPTLSLPADHASVSLSMSERGGPAEDEGPRDGIIVRTIALHPEVIVLPVYVHVFLGEDEDVPRDLSPEMIRYRFDPGHALVTESVLVNDSQNGLEAYTTLAAHERFPILADTVWTQCDIQFRLAGVQYVEQGDGLEASMFQIGDCTGIGAGGGVDCNGNGTFMTYRDSLQTNAGINIYIGGIFEAGCGPSSTVAYTCGPAIHCSGERSPSDFIAVERGAMRSRPDVFAHELGHFLGLGHSDDTCTSDTPITWGTMGNIMNASGASTGDGGAVSLSLARLTAAQCSLARETAEALRDELEGL